MNLEDNNFEVQKSASFVKEIDNVDFDVTASKSTTEELASSIVNGIYQQMSLSMKEGNSKEDVFKPEETESQTEIETHFSVEQEATEAQMSTDNVVKDFENQGEEMLDQSEPPESIAINDSEADREDVILEDSNYEVQDRASFASEFDNVEFDVTATASTTEELASNIVSGVYQRITISMIEGNAGEDALDYDDAESPNKVQK